MQYKKLFVLLTLSVLTFKFILLQYFSMSSKILERSEKLQNVSLIQSHLNYSNKVHFPVHRKTKKNPAHIVTTTTTTTTTLKPPKKRILFWGTFYGSSNLDSYCIIDAERSMSFCEYDCEYSTNQSNATLEASDAVVFHGRETLTEFPGLRLSHQHWVYLMFESPDNTFTNITHWNKIFNWTMSYRPDSDVFIPYGKLITKSQEIKIAAVGSEEFSDYLQSHRKHLGFKRLGAWAVSNCEMVTSKRKSVFDELSKYIGIDIYGTCGLYQCPGNSRDQCNAPQKCFEYLGPLYKFYFAFENSICEDYITEKFFNSFKYGMVPVVLGPKKEDYLKHAPEGSFIHVDDFENLKDLAKYLQYLDENDDEYLNYFMWKMDHELDPVYYFQRAWCNLCTKLHTTESTAKIKFYENIYNWWFYKDDKSVCKYRKYDGFNSKG